MQTGRRIAALLLFLAAANAAAAATFETASDLYEADRFHEALQAFEEVARGGDGHEQRTTARFYAAQCRIQLGDYATADRELEQLLAELGPDAATPALLFRAGEAARMQGDSKRARTRLRDFVSLHATHPYAPYAWKYLGELAAEAEEWPAASAYFSQCINSPHAEGTAAAARLELAHALNQLGQPEAAADAVAPLADNSSHPLAPAGAARAWESAIQGRRLSDRAGIAPTLIARLSQRRASPGRPHRRGLGALESQSR